MVNSNWNDISMDCANANKRMKDILLYLKTMGITKNLENLLKIHKINVV